MGRFESFFLLEPPSFFGLPEGQKTVVRVSDGPIHGAWVDTRTLLPIGHGTLSRFRALDEALFLQVELGGIAFQIRDNIVHLAFEAIDDVSGRTRALAVMRRFVRVLTAEQSYLFDFIPLQCEFDGLPRRWPPDRDAQVLSATIYDLVEMKGRLERSIPRSLLADERLDKALLYLEHGWFLYTVREQARGTHHHAMIVASAFLQLWKAVTTLLGEPDTDADYQRRHRSFGLPRTFWEERMKPLYRVRNEEDVAHYSLSMDQPALDESFGKAALVGRDAIAAYAEHLLKVKQSGSG
jgi:hypothetical protein